MWLYFLRCIFFCGSTPQVLYSGRVCRLRCRPMFAGQHQIPIEKVAFMCKTHHTRVTGVGWARVTPSQPVPVCTRAPNPHRFTNPWHSLQISTDNTDVAEWNQWAQIYQLLGPITCWEQHTEGAQYRAKGWRLRVMRWVTACLYVQMFVATHNLLSLYPIYPTHVV